MALTKEELDQIKQSVSEEASTKTKEAVKEAETSITAKFEDFKKGLMTKSEFESFKAEKMDPINEVLAKVSKMEEASKAQGEAIQKIQLQKGAENSKSIEQFIEEQLGDTKKMKDLRSSGKCIEFTGAELKAAGVQSIAGTIPTASPYAPGPSGPLDIFNVQRNPNFITSKVDLGKSNQSILAWANELETIEGGAGLVDEGAQKPQVQHKFEVETSKAKKVAGWVKLTEEFDQDLPNFATNVRRMLQDDVYRAWDDQIQTDVIAAARPFEITALNGQIASANYYDALLALLGQVGSYNYPANTLALNWLTNVVLKTQKNDNRTPILPAFAGDIEGLQTFANKMAFKNVLAGDLKQYKVDIYKDFVLKIGWVNDDFITNQFVVLGEMRYHSYISSARKKALAYDNLDTIISKITSLAS